MHVRFLTCVCLAALATPAAADTFKVGPDAEHEHASEIVMQANRTYTVTVAGTVTVDYPSTHDPQAYRIYDAMFCVETNFTKPQEPCDQKELLFGVHMKQGPYDVSFSPGGEGRDAFTYTRGNEYVMRYKAPAAGALTVTSNYPPFASDTEKWSGAFTVTVEEPNASGACNGKAATIVGEDDDPTGANRIFGTPGPDVIVGTPGNDLILGGGGDDVICAGGGSDHVNSGGGNDQVFGGAGADTLAGNDGNDVLQGGNDDDELKGGPGGDRLNGGNGDDTLDGGAGGKDGAADLLVGGADDDHLIGRHANAVADYRTSPRRVKADLGKGRATGWGRDVLSGINILFGSAGADTLVGSNRRDFITGEGGDDRIAGRAGDDRLLGGNGTDVVFGGADEDRCAAETTSQCEIDVISPGDPARAVASW